MLNMAITNYPESRRYILILKSAHGTTDVVNYMADNNYLNTFLSTFDVWGSGGHHKSSDDKNYCEVWFEMSKEFYDMVKTETMQQAFKRFGVRVETEYSKYYTPMSQSHYL